MSISLCLYLAFSGLREHARREPWVTYVYIYIYIEREREGERYMS